MTSIQKSRSNETFAFTMVEILIVVVVMAIAAVMAMPMLGETRATRLAAAVELLVADMQFAQLESLTHANEPRGIRFDAVNGKYAVVKQVGSTFDCATAEVVNDPVGGAPLEVVFGSGRGGQLTGVTIQAGFSLGGDDCLVFEGFGQTDQTTVASVTLVCETASMTVNVDPISGETTIIP